MDARRQQERSSDLCIAGGLFVFLYYFRTVVSWLAEVTNSNVMLGVNLELMSSIGLEEESYQFLVLGSLLIPA